MQRKRAKEDPLDKAARPVSRRRVGRRTFLWGLAGVLTGAGALAVQRRQSTKYARTATPERVATHVLPFANGQPYATSGAGTLHPWKDSTGWGYRVAADKSSQKMVDDMRLLKSWGSNTVWLTHANPAWEVDPLAEEANFSVKDYVALVHHTHEQEGAARQLEALHNALRAAREVGLKVVLSTGYQTSPGKWWADQYPQDLRRARDGSNPVRPGWGNPEHWYASLYSPRYRDLCADFGLFVKENVIDQHAGTVIAIINSDEPTVTDFSHHADATFRNMYDMPMAQAMRIDPYSVGEFQTRSWAHLAAWFATLWQQLDPQLWNLNTFHFERTAPWFPSIGAIFETATSNMAVSYDSHPQDTDTQDPFSHDHQFLLRIMARSVAFQARAYAHQNEHYKTTPLMLWAGGNRWSLNYAYDEPEQGHATVKDAVDSAYDVVRETKRVGGEVAALLAWHFDIPHQQLPEAMQQEAFDKVSAAMRDMGRSLSTPSAQPENPSIILSYNEERVLTEVGKHGIFDLYDRFLLPQLLTRRGLDLQGVSADNAVVLPINSHAYNVAMRATQDVREIQLF